MEVTDGGIYSELQLSTEPQVQNDYRPQQTGELIKLVCKTMQSAHRLRDEWEVE